MVGVIKLIQDYCAEEDFQYYIDPEESKWIEVHHFKGGARAYADGRVESALNFKLKAVMERKIAEAKAMEMPAQHDGQGRVIIKFATRYEKAPDLQAATKLLAVLKVREEEIQAPFLVYDTKFLGEDEYFPLQKSEYKLVLLLLTEEVPKHVLWTTVRTWDLGKEQHYRNAVGQYVTIQVGREAR